MSIEVEARSPQTQTASGRCVTLVVNLSEVSAVQPEPPPAQESSQLEATPTPTSERLPKP